MTKQTKQFTTKKPKKEYYDRKVTHTKTTKILCLGRLIPNNWRYVRFEVTKRSKNMIACKIIKLLDVDDYAQSTKINKGHKQNT